MLRSIFRLRIALRGVKCGTKRFIEFGGLEISGCKSPGRGEGSPRRKLHTRIVPKIESFGDFSFLLFSIRLRSTAEIGELRPPVYRWPALIIVRPQILFGMKLKKLFYKSSSSSKKQWPDRTLYRRTNQIRQPTFLVSFLGMFSLNNHHRRHGRLGAVIE